MSAESIFARPLRELSAGERFASAERTITESDVVRFAALTGDAHPLHLDTEWASRSLFGGRVVHGMLLISYAFGLLPIDPRHVVALRALRDVVFKRPVTIGATVRASGMVEEVRALSDDLGLVQIRLEVGVRDEPPACILRAQVLWRADVTAGEPKADDARG